LVKAEVGHGAGGGADVEGIARRNEYDMDGMGGSGQETIVVATLVGAHCRAAVVILSVLRIALA